MKTEAKGVRDGKSRAPIVLDQKLAAIMAALRELEGDRAEDLREAVLGQLEEE